MAFNTVENYLIDIGYYIQHPDVSAKVICEVVEYLVDRGEIDKDSLYSRRQSS